MTQCEPSPTFAEHGSPYLCPEPTHRMAVDHTLLAALKHDESRLAELRRYL